jgi:hypothetical protein
MSSARFSKEQLKEAALKMNARHTEVTGKLTRAVTDREYCVRKFPWVLKAKRKVADLDEWLRNWSRDGLRPAQLVAEGLITEEERQDFWRMPRRIQRMLEYLDMAEKSMDGVVVLDDYEFHPFKDYL